MKVRTSIVTAGALLALVVPAAANAAAAKADPVLYDAIPSKPATSGHKSSHHLVIRKSHTTKTKSQAAKTSTGKSSKIFVAPRYIYVAPQATATQVQASSGDAADNCLEYMVDCTGQQYCDNWGFNCNSVGTSDSASDSQAKPAPVESPASDPTTDVPAPVASSASNSSTAASGPVDNTTEAYSDDC